MQQLADVTMTQRFGRTVWFAQKVMIGGRGRQNFRGLSAFEAFEVVRLFCLFGSPLVSRR